MPKLKKSDAEMFNKRLSSNIKRGMDMYDITSDSMALRMGVSRSTMYARLRNPQEMKLGELSAAAKAIHTTPVALLQEAGQ